MSLTDKHHQADLVAAMEATAAAEGDWLRAAGTPPGSRASGSGSRR
ncbi:MAG TPA: hypothetical protein VM533_09595 [Fimbriiglobus sp.]|nr:hypothetical protein [Fimbriiglobus sp.]